MATVGLCNKDLNIHDIKDIIYVKGYKTWYENLEPVDTKHVISHCLENTVKRSLKIVVCCKEDSERMINSIHHLICSEKNKDDTNFYCKILHLITSPENMKSLSKIIEMFGICRDRCPLDLPTKHKGVTRDLDRLQKRQFDLASTFDVLKQHVCYDVLGSSRTDTPSMFIDFIENELDDRTGNVSDPRFLTLKLFRRPACCLLKGQV